MCIVVYLAADRPLPTLAWDESQPGFHVTELEAHAEPVRERFSMPFVYYAGSHAGCGCGFCLEDGIYPNAADPAEERASRRALANFLTGALRIQHAVELFACWSGDEGEPATGSGHLRPADLLRDEMIVPVEELVLVTESPG